MKDSDSDDVTIIEIDKNGGSMIPISSAKQMADNYNYDQIIILGRRVGKDGEETLTTYGKTKKHCGVAAMIGKFLKDKVFKWKNG